MIKLTFLLFWFFLWTFLTRRFSKNNSLTYVLLLYLKISSVHDLCFRAGRSKAHFVTLSTQTYPKTWILWSARAVENLQTKPAPFRGLGLALRFPPAPPLRRPNTYFRKCVRSRKLAWAKKDPATSQHVRSIICMEAIRLPTWFVDFGALVTCIKGAPCTGLTDHSSQLEYLCSLSNERKNNLANLRYKS